MLLVAIGLSWSMFNRKYFVVVDTPTNGLKCFPLNAIQHYSTLGILFAQVGILELGLYTVFWSQWLKV